ncbi:uncharacterized protein [Argopecten irradians]
MQTFETENPSKTSERCGESQRPILMLGGVILLTVAVILVLTIVLLDRQESSPDFADNRQNSNIDTGYVLSANDMSLYLASTRRWVNITDEVDPRSCEEIDDFRWLTDSIIHGCCTSSPKFFALTTVTALNGTSYNLAANQVFPIETCDQTNGCDTCTCTMVDGVFQAKTTGGSIVWFELKSCCKCLTSNQ